jgi:hypothetical protein
MERRAEVCDSAAAELTRLEEDRESEIDGLEREVVVLVDEQEVLGLEVAVHDPERVAGLDDADDDPGELGGLALAVVAALYDPVEELAPGAELHDDVDVELVLVGALDGDDVGVAGEVVHDLDLAAHVVDVLPGDELALGDGLAGVVDPRGELGAEEGGAELPLPELPAERVEVAEVGGGVAEHGPQVRRRAGPAAPHGGGGRRRRRVGVRGGGRRWRLPGRVVGHGAGAVLGGGVALRRRGVLEAVLVLGSKGAAACVAHQTTGWSRRPWRMKLRTVGHGRLRARADSRERQRHQRTEPLIWVGSGVGTGNGGERRKTGAGARSRSSGLASRDLTLTTRRQLQLLLLHGGFSFLSLQLGSGHVSGESERTQRLVAVRALVRSFVWIVPVCGLGLGLGLGSGRR